MLKLQSCMAEVLSWKGGSSAEREAGLTADLTMPIQCLRTLHHTCCDMERELYIKEAFQGFTNVLQYYS